MREPRLSVAFFLKVLTAGVTVAAVIPVAVILFLNHEQTDQRIRDNTSLAIRLNQERIDRQTAINQFIYEQCVEDEVRDTVNVQTDLAIIKVLRLVPHPSRPIRDVIVSLEDAIAALEPPGEQDCVPPSANKP